MSLEDTSKRLHSENHQSQKPTQGMIPWMGNVQNRQIHSGCLHREGGQCSGEWALMASEFGGAVLTFLFSLWLNLTACGVPQPEIEPLPLQWKIGILTTGPPGKPRFGGLECSGIIHWWWLHHSVTILNISELNALNGLILWCVNNTSKMLLNKEMIIEKSTEFSVLFKFLSLIVFRW